MIQITKIPADFTPIPDGLCFGIECSEPSDVEVLVIDAQSDEVVGRKLLYGVNEAQFDIAPYVARFEPIAPVVSGSSIITPAPIAEYRIEANGRASETIRVSNNLSLPLSQGVITTAADVRHIAHGEHDELRIISRPGAPIRADLTTDEGYTLSLDYTSSPGYATLHLATADLPVTTRRAELCILSDDMTVREITYHFVPRYGESCRLAWLSEVGSVERYTFPTVSRLTRRAERTECRSADGGAFGVRSRTESVMRLTSGVECRATIASIAGIVSAPMVWVEDGGRVERVDLLTTEVRTHAFGKPDTVTAEICRSGKEVRL